ncbi:hypothetical protein MYMA111404_01015 [Mycoplasma marinum]|uniref:Aldose epimerase n=1 Tax=Mycoplasma marinum TaxID=1937190 RepID=A0A4R0XVW3_9MOLU|nr:hypothetical protein [Mycoplasma marinum]TCG12015.1 hypothetical protein C4B24_00175 [Mycoplasma marinum]
MKLNNEYIEIEINDNAEIISVKFEDKELLYQANETWKKQFPIIFPSLGISKGFSHNGKTFEMPKHGFWKNLAWESFFENGEILSVATLMDKEKFPFFLDITQRIGVDQDTFYINYEIANLEDKESFFHFGIHPAFKIDDSTFISNLPETKIIDLEGKLTNRELSIRGLLIDSLGFGEDYDTLIAQNIEDKSIILNTENHQLHMKFDSPHLQIWKPKNDNFICIEPWYGKNDAWYKAPSEVSKKEEIISLSPGSIWSATFEVKVKNNK